MSAFDLETRLHPIGPMRWSGHVHAAWNIGNNPNGGYLLALAVSALRQAAPVHPDPLSVTVHFLRPGLADQPCEIEAQVLRSGRTLTTSRATLMQGGVARLEVLAACGDLASAVQPRLAPAPPAMPPPEDCPPRSGEQQGIALPIMDRLDIRLHPNDGLTGGGQAQVSGWIRFHDGRAPDTLASVLFADAFPPAVFGLLGMIGWVPTVELTVHIRRRPAPGWMIGQFRSSDLIDGRLIEDGALWDCEGNLVAQVRQLALIRQGERKI